MKVCEPAIPRGRDVQKSKASGATNDLGVSTEDPPGRANSNSNSGEAGRCILRQGIMLASTGLRGCQIASSRELICAQHPCQSCTLGAQKRAEASTSNDLDNSKGPSKLWKFTSKNTEAL